MENNFENPSLATHEGIRDGFGEKEKYLHLDFEVTAPPEAQEKQRLYYAQIERMINDPDNYLDKGGAAKVYALGDSTLCIKIMRERYLPHDEDDVYDKGNSPMQEARFLEEMSGFDVEGVHAPHFVELLQGKDCKAITMEQLPALNMQHILNGSQQLPENFDLDVFLDDLEAYIDEMHYSKKILHNDLKARNIMVDKDTMKPRLIDFGRAVHLQHITNEVERNKLIHGEWKQFDSLSQKLKRELTFIDNSGKL